MYQDYKDLLSAFHAHGVKYLTVGGEISFTILRWAEFETLEGVGSPHMRCQRLFGEYFVQP